MSFKRNIWLPAIGFQCNIRCVALFGCRNCIVQQAVEAAFNFRKRLHQLNSAVYLASTMKLAFAAILLWAFIGCSSGIKYPVGGHDFVKPAYPGDDNFYYLPIRDSLSRKDSFLAIWEAKYVSKYFDEPNLSLQPTEDIFRFSYSEALGGNTFISLTKRSIIVRQSIPGIGYNYYTDDSLLTEKERQHLQLLKLYYPFNQQKFSGRVKQKLDSLLVTYPELNDPNYYLKLIDKTVIRKPPAKQKYLYRKIPITEADFEQLVTEINNSGYWQLPIHVECINSPNDGYGYILEANAGGKYKCVISGCCENQEALPLAKACQRLIDKAGLNQKITVYSPEPRKVEYVTVPDVELQPIAPDTPKHTKKKH
jgi:hypothetical protein